MEEGIILHLFLAGEAISEKDGTIGSYYRGKYQPFTFPHNLQELETVAKEFKEQNSIYFTSEWKRECEYKAPINYGLYSYEISGIFDLFKIDGDKAEIGDFKTGQTVVDTSSIESCFQAVLYSYLVLDKHKNVETVTFSYIYTKIGIVKQISFSRNDIETLRFYILMKIAISENVGYKDGSHCVYCARLSSCPIIMEKIDRFCSGTKEQDWKELKLIEKAISIMMEEKKKEFEKDDTLWSWVKAFYVNTAALTPEQKQLIESEKERKKISKAVAIKLQEMGAEVEESGFRKLKI
jgi:hypothetical protein